MLIKKNYNVKSLAETLEGALSVALDDREITVEIGLLEASEILDVLNETNKREQKHQTLENACNFMEMEDGTQTNEMELHNKKDENGNILRSMDCNLDERECMNETKERERCFGKSYGKRPIIICGTCKYAKRCEVLTKNE